MNTLYFIGAHNIPNANVNDDIPSMAVNFTLPGKRPHPHVTLCPAGPPALVRGLVQGGQESLDRARGLAESWFPPLERGHHSNHLTHQVEER